MDLGKELRVIEAEDLDLEPAPIEKELPEPVTNQKD